MSILYCSIPNFLVTLAQRESALPPATPFALLGEDDRVWALSAAAQRYGITTEMPARQARAHCPDLILRPLNLAESEAQQNALLTEVGAWELPVETYGWGAGWIDLHSHTKERAEVQRLAGELGKRIRATLGNDLAPSMGWDSSKFTSRVAAHAVRSGAMRLIGKDDEKRFLAPQPVNLLPLPPIALQQLDWLGVDTLGHFAALPSAGVLQRWGKGGRIAQQWAQGNDNRPIIDGIASPPEAIEVEFDPPTERLGPVLADTLQQMQPLLSRLAQHLRGIRRMDLRCSFVTGPNRLLKITFIEAASDPARLQAALLQHMQSMIWHDELEKLTIHITETGELAAGQLSLFPADEGDDASVAASLAQELAVRYGQVVYLGQLTEPLHPAHDHLWRWQPL